MGMDRRANLHTDLENFASLITHDHLAGALESGFYNPAMRLMFAEDDGSLLGNLVFLHELEHAKLCVSVYGCVTAYLRWLSIDSLVFWANYGSLAEFGSFWKLSTICRQNGRELHSAWTVLHEGLATFCDWEILLQVQGTTEGRIYFDRLSAILEDQSAPYAKGFWLLWKWFNAFPHSYQIRQIVHQLANVDITEILDRLLQSAFAVEAPRFRPDSLLQLLIQQVASAQNNLEVINQIQPSVAREFIGQCVRPSPTFMDFEAGHRDLFDELLATTIASNSVPDDYRRRIHLLRREHAKFEVGSVSSWLYFPAVRTVRDGKSTTSIPKGKWTENNIEDPSRLATGQLYDEVVFLCSVDELIRDFLPQTPDLFQHKLQMMSADMGKMDYYYLLIASMYPTTTEKALKEIERTRKLRNQARMQ